MGWLTMADIGIESFYGQVDSLYEGITSNFDAYRDHIPTVDSLEEYFRNKKMLCVRG